MQPNLFSESPFSAFGGKTIEPCDVPRLTRQLDKVRELMKDGKWRTLSEIGQKVSGSEAALSARLRDLRKQDFGGFTIERRRRGEDVRGLHEYRMASPE